MCVFSRWVRHVGATKIFAGHRDDGRQVLVYAMEVELDEPTAMVLPLPTPDGVAEDAVELVSLAGYPTFFDDLAQAFPALGLGPAMAQPAGRGGGGSSKPLVVHRVGQFVASFAPTVADLERLDPQFRLSAAARTAVTRDRDGWSFAVIQLASQRREHVHPIALTFPRRDPTALYFPTVHVHGNHVPATAAFDHTLYYQPDAAVAATTPSTPSTASIAQFVDLSRACGLVGPGPTFALALFGELANDDVHAMLPPAVTAADVIGRGATWEYQLGIRHGYDLSPGNARRHTDVPTAQLPGNDPAHLAVWHRTARTCGSAVAAALRAWCERFAAEHAARLTPLVPTLPPYYFNGPNLWSSTTGGRIKRGPGAIDFRPWSPRVEFQRVVVAFADMPDQIDATFWRDDLVRALDAAAA